MRKSIGIDLGGTNLRVGIVDSNGYVIAEEKFPTNPEKGYDHSINNIILALEKFDIADIDTVGIGAPGPLNAREGILLESPNLPSWKNVNIVNILEDRLNKRVFLENDANVASLAEAIYGAGKDYDNVCYITLSTGVGGGIVIDKKLISGAYGIAAEIGNIILDPSGIKHSNMNKGCFESFCSGGAILKSAIRKGSCAKSTMEVFELYNRGDSIAIESINEFFNYLGMGISNIIHVINPNIFVLGGGVTKSLVQYNLMDNVYDCIQQYQFDSTKNKVVVRSAELDDCGLVGAAILPWYDDRKAVANT